MLIAVVCIGDNHVMGYQGKLPWEGQMPEDMRYFRKITKGHTVVMGRKTYESIGKPLRGRQNVIVTRDEGFTAEGCTVVHSIEDVITMGEAEDVYVIGGAEIFKWLMPWIERIHLTRIYHDFDGDAFFRIPMDEFTVIDHEEHPADYYNAYPYIFVVSERVL